jgi:cold shock CspA family protein
MLCGVLVHWNLDRGFGFVRSDDDGREFFVHVSSFDELDRLDIAKFARVFFLSLQKQEGRPHHCNQGSVFERRMTRRGTVIARHDTWLAINCGGKPLAAQREVCADWDGMVHGVGVELEVSENFVISSCRLVPLWNP